MPFRSICQKVKPLSRCRWEPQALAFKNEINYTGIAKIKYIPGIMWTGTNKRRDNTLIFLVKI
jgi:hypothetical protein